MNRILPIVLLLLALATPAGATVELALQGNTPTTITEVYLRNDIPFLAIGDVLSALKMRGHWDSVAHIYDIRTAKGTAVISPGSHYLRLGEKFTPIDPQPRFIDGRLRVPQSFVTKVLPKALGVTVYYRNLNPPEAIPSGNGSSLDQLFAFLLRKKKPSNAPTLRGVAIDPGHGGQDVGALGLEGSKEKDIDLQVAKRLEKKLKMQLGIPVYLSRTGDYTVTRRQRLATADHPDVDAFLILHAQAAFTPAAHGVILFVRPKEESAAGTPAEVGGGESMRLARSLADALSAAGFTVDGTWRAPLLPLGRGDLPTVLVEMGYLTNPADQSMLSDPAGDERLAGALFNGLKSFADHAKPKH
ncbi:MAG TPA: N-acetylmuramoyl-L-alanine amidase [Desulfuromonadales bacterium]|nr:N-acetylmuramoyl-L-alanine amidase [Desulfuromonadales bacterium]